MEMQAVMKSKNLACFLKQLPKLIMRKILFYDHTTVIGQSPSELLVSFKHTGTSLMTLN